MGTKIRVAVVSGGFTAEENISMQSAEIVLDSLDPDLYELTQIVISRDRWYVLADGSEVDKNDFSIRKKGLSYTFDVVFNAIHGSPGEDGKLQGYLDLLGIPYTSSGVLASALTFDKGLTKELLSSVDVGIARSLVLERKNRSGFDLKQVQEKLKLPLFVKPNQNGSSYGISKVKVWPDLSAAIEKSFQFDDQVMIEEFIEGIELTCGLIEDGEDLFAFPITEIVSKSEFFDYKAKYTAGEADEITPARISPELASRVQDLSREIYSKTKCKGLVRIDYIVDREKIYLLEVNSVPGMSANSIVPKQVKTVGWSIGRLFAKMIDNAINTKGRPED